MRNWLWVVLIVVGSGVACVLIWMYSNRHNIFKRRSKDEKKAKKQTKKIAKDEKKAKKVVEAAQKADAETRKDSDELSFSEKQIEVIDNIKIQSEGYVPSDDFAGTDTIEYASLPRRMPRRRPVEMPKREYNFEAQTERESLKDQLRSLTPEMKAVVFGNLLDRKDDQF